MESVLAGIIIFFLILFAALTLTGDLVGTQELLYTSWEESQVHAANQMQDHLTFVHGRYSSTVDVLELTYRNEGQRAVGDFEHWDVIVQYYDAVQPDANHYIERLSYNRIAADLHEWAVKDIYLNAADSTPEVYQPGILDPGEEIVLQLKLSPTLGAGKTIQATLAMTSGWTVSGQFTRNIPPVLDINTGFSVTHRESVDIPNTALQVTDEDDVPESLVYVLEATPSAGELNLGHTFTQADIDNGLLSYTHTGAGAGSDQFDFRVTDGDDTIGIYTVPITITNDPPNIVRNVGLTMLSGGANVVDGSRLLVNDPDNTAEELTFTVVNGPAQGILSPATTFTQADVNAGLVGYTHTGTGNDTFSFSVSDGDNTIGLFWFNVTVP